jgi:hypothetical protein
MKINQDFEALIMKTVSWHFGRDVVIKKVRGKTIVTSFPDMSKRELSPKQLEMNELMDVASGYAKAIIRNEELKNAAQLRLNVTSNRLYHALVREYLKTNIPKNEILSGKG